MADPRGPSMSRLGLTCCTRTVGPDVRPGLRNGTGLHTALGYSNSANLINNRHDEIRKASLIQLICPVRRGAGTPVLRSGQPTGAMALASPGCAGSGADAACLEGSGGNDLRVKGDQVNLSRMGGLAVAVGLATIAAGLVPTVARASAPGASPVPAVTQYTGTPGVARLVPRTTPAAGAPSAPGPTAARRLPSGHYSATETMPAAPASAAAAAAATSSALVNFDGVSSRDSQFTNFEQTFEPPDQGLCEGNGFVLEPVNSAYRIYRTTGKSLRGPFNINDLFNVGGKEFTSDPRCWFDPSTQTWFATILFINDSSTASSLLIAVRHNPDPRGLWNEYSIDTTDPGGNGCPCFGDQPRIGIDQTNLYVTADEFSILGPQFNGAEMWAIDKSDLVAGAASPHFVQFANLTIDGQLTLAPQPALSTGRPNAEYFLSSLDPNGTGDNRIGVWAMTNRDQVGAGGTPIAVQHRHQLRGVRHPAAGSAEGRQEQAGLRRRPDAADANSSAARSGVS